MALKKKKRTGKPALKKTAKKKTVSKQAQSKQRPPQGTSRRKTEIKKAEKAKLPGKNKQVAPALCVVGVGASAGGLEALEGLFTRMPVKSNMAFVVIQHLAPAHKSIMGSLLQKYTGISIHQIKDGVKVEANCMYLNPPDKDVSILNGSLYLTEPQDKHATRLPIDFFFRALAQDQKERAICIILSGTGTDGTLGLKAVKSEGGMTMVQQESQAKYDSMPRNAINTGLVDFVLPVEEMPGELTKYTRHPYIDTRKDLYPQAGAPEHP